MSNLTNYKHTGNYSPYYDDFDMKKNYMKVAYKPGVAVQARELNQTQSIIQNQLSSANSYMYKDGNSVNGARININTKQLSMRVDRLPDGISSGDVFFSGNDSSVSIKVLFTDTVLDNGVEKYYILYTLLGNDLSSRDIKFNKQNSAYTTSTSFNVYTSNTEHGAVYNDNGTNKMINAVCASCSEGIIYHNGFFIYVPAQNICINHDYNNTENYNKITYNIGFLCYEKYTNYTEDSSLLDPALGSSNYGAYGADRLEEQLVLYSFDNSKNISNIINNIMEDTNENGKQNKSIYSNIDFIQGIVLRDNHIIKEQNTGIEDTELMDVLAKRTYDESGSYTVIPWKIYVQPYKSSLFYNNLSDFYDSDGNNIIKTSNEIKTIIQNYTNDNRNNSYVTEYNKLRDGDYITEDDVYTISIQEGSGYIRGYNVSTTSVNNYIVKKPRDAKSTMDKYSYDTYISSCGLYTFIDRDSSGLINGRIPIIGTSCEVLKSTGVSTYGSFSTELSIMVTGYSLINGSLAMFFKFNGDERTLDFKNGKRLKFKLSGEVNDSYLNLKIDDTFGTSLLYGSNKSSIYPVNDTNIATIGSTTYSTYKLFTITSTSTDSIVISSSVYEPKGNTIISIYNKTNNLQINLYGVTTNITTNNNTNTITITKSGAFTVSSVYEVLIECDHDSSNNVPYRRKTLKYGKKENADLFPVVNSVPTFNSNVNLNKDTVVILSVKNHATTGEHANKTYSYELIKNINDYSYGTSYLKFTNNNIDATTERYVDIEYLYFEHDSNTGPFTIDSYTSDENKMYALQYGYTIKNLIPVYTDSNGTTYDLSDCYDFRDSETLPSINNTIKSNISKYLGRIDLVCVSHKGEFNIIEGIPSENPSALTTNSYFMPIYSVYNSSYAKSLSDIVPSYINNERYTMADIGRLKNRIAVVEEGLSLTQLELNALSAHVVDSQGEELYKTGIFTDSFGTYDNSDYNNSLWSASIDATEQYLRPAFETDSFDMEVDTKNTSNVSIMSKDVTISGNTNTHNIVAVKKYTTEVYASNMSSSEYRNVQSSMFHFFNGNLSLYPSIDTWEDKVADVIVSNITTGASETQPDSFSSYSTTTSTSTATGYYTNLNGNSLTGNSSLVRNSNYRTTLTTTSTIKTTTSYQESIKTTKTSTKREEDYEYMRQRDVDFICTGMRPGTYLYGTIGGTQINSTGWKVGTDGSCSGTFTIPEGVACGTKTVVFEDEYNTSYADTTYTAYGKYVWNDISVNNVRSWIPVTTKTTTNTTTTVTNRYVDPLAETFIIKETTGVFIDSIDIFFQSRADESKKSVWVYIVEAENGYPTERMLPFSKVQKKYNEVNLDNGNLTNPTTFKFDTPIYLSGGDEYAFVVACDTYEYNIWMSTLGKLNLVDGIGIFEQPYTGCMFTSQNASTWVPLEESDISFVMKRCVFDMNDSKLSLKLKYDENLYSGNSSFVASSNLSDYPVDVVNINTNVFNTDFTNTVFSYKFGSNDTYTEYNNKIDIYLNDRKLITTGNDKKNLFVNIDMKTNSNYVSPIIDLEQINAIFTHNLIKAKTGTNGYDYGVYVSKEVPLNYGSSDIRLFLDVYCPYGVNITPYIKTNTYNSRYVNSGVLLNGHENVINNIINKVSNVYTYTVSSGTYSLAKSTLCYINGYNNGKIYLGNVQDDSTFADNTSVFIVPKEELDTSSVTIYTYTGSSYSTNEYVIYNGNVWKSLSNSNSSIPSAQNGSWALINIIIVSDSIKTNNNDNWREMKPNRLINGTSNFVEICYTPIETIEQEFDNFVIKIVSDTTQQTINYTDVPLIKNLRAIATI